MAARKPLVLAPGGVQELASADTLLGYAQLIGAAFTGPTTVPTAVATDSSTNAATTAYVTNATSRVNVNRGTVALTSAATVTTDASLQNNFTLTLGVNAVLANPTNLAAGASYAWTVKQDATGGRLLTYGTAFKWSGNSAPTLSTAANAVDLITAISDGTNLYAVATTAFATAAVAGATPGVASFNTRTGTVTLTSGDVTGALTFTPYNATNPSSYIAAAGAPVQTVAGRTGAVVLAVADVSGAAAASSIPAAGSVAPVMDGTATVGVGTAFSRQDHVHPSDTSRYAANNPSAFIAAAGAPVQSVAGRTGAVVLAVADVSGAAAASSVPVAGSAAPVMNGTAAVGVGTAFSRQDHVHPSDTSRYAANNPSGYQTAAQVATTASRVNVNRGSVALTSAASIATDASLQNNFTVTLTVSGALANPTNLAAGASYAWTIRQDATGGRLLTYGTAFKWPGGVVPTLSTAANAVDLVTAISDGTNLYAVVSKGFA